MQPDLFDKYKDLKIIDVHNHDADYYEEKGSMAIWEQYHIDKTVLFGAISEPAAMISDNLSWEAYTKYPDKFFPFFSGFSMYHEEALTIVKEKLEQGYYGIGETVAASTYSPLTSKLKWKALHPMDGNLPRIYKLCEEYKVPILLHIDPPFGEPIEKLKEALRKFPNTKIIFGHGNVYNPPESLDCLLSQHHNLYIDFFAGFTAYDPNNKYPLESYIPLIKKYSDRFFLSTDSATACNLDYEKAINAMYEVIDLCEDNVIGERIGRLNFLKIIEEQPATQSQKDLIERNNVQFDVMEINKRMANELIIANKLES